ncbi:MAG: DUF2490 domain-containing protein [Bacteroidia bacterium]|nr:DUF2490 domain-containing protein [Bacteroidia bacterium]
MKKLFTIGLLLVVFYSKGQFFSESQEWIGFYSSFSGKKIQIKSDFQARWKDNFGQWKNFLFRIGVRKQYRFPKGGIGYFSAGPAFFFASADGRPVFYPEFRLWQEGGLESTHLKFPSALRLRVEERWISNSEGEFNYFTRLRLKTEISRRIGLKKNPDSKTAFLFSNEILFQHNHQLGFYPEHDRISLGFQFYFLNELGFQFQYTIMPFVRTNSSQYEKRQVFRLNLLLDL